MLRRVKPLFAAALLTSFSLPASAATIDLIANMDCAQANAGAGTCGAGGSGTGLGLFTYDDVTNLLSWEISWSGLSGTPTVQHLHGAANPDQNAGVRVNIGVAGNPVIGSTVITEAYETELLSGLWYVNLHSDAFNGGEIRGQISVVPVPAAAWLFVSGLGMLGWMRRRQLS